MKKVIRCLAFALILFLVILGLYRVLSWKDTTDGYLSCTEQLYHTGDDLIDAVFLGSSHTYCSIYPSVIWHEEGISAFDYSISGQDRKSGYYGLKEVLKTQSPKVVFVELYSMMYDRAPQEWMVYRNVLSLKPSVNSFQLITDLVDEEDRGDYYLRFPIIHSRYNELQKYDYLENPVNEYARGEWLGWRIDPRELSESRLVTDVTELSDDNRQWFDDLRALAEKEDFELVFYVAPYAVTDNQQAILNGAKEYAAEYGIDCYDFNLLAEEVGLDPSHDMLDQDHTNGYGATKVSSYIGQLLKERYGLTDHTGDSSYEQWDQDYERYLHSYYETVLSETINTVDYNELAKTIDDVVIYYSLEGDYSNIHDWITQLGISEEEMAGGGKWIYQDGELTKLMNNEVGVLILQDYGRYSNVILQYVPSNPVSDILVDGQAYATEGNGLNILVYDTFTGQVLGTKSISN